MRLYVTEIDAEHSNVEIGILKSGGMALSWGSGKKEVRKILAGIDAELAAAKAGLGGEQQRSPNLRLREGGVLDGRSGRDIALQRSPIGARARSGPCRLRSAAPTP
jgi:hypothetical protein